MTLTLHRWQEECLALLRQRVISPTVPGIVQAVTGGGKSLVQSKLVSLLVSTLPKDQITFVATSRRVLVEQLFKDVSEHVAKQMLGYYFGDGKRYLGKRAIFTTYASLTDCVRAVTSQGGKVGAVLLDEAHNTGSEATNEWLMEQVSTGLKRVYGFTATDFRGNPKERLQWCSERIYSYPFAQAVADKVIVDYVYKGRAGDVVDTDDDIIQMIHATDAIQYGAGLVTAKSIEDAKAFAARLSEAGLLARHVASDLGRRVIPEVEEGFRSGAILAITSPRLVAEGYDYPPLKWMCFRAPLTMQGRVLAIQTVGRVLRRVRPQKFPAEVRRWGLMEKALLLDPRGSFEQIGITHHPALGPIEEEITPEPTRPEKEATEVAIQEPRPDHLDSVEESVAWARGVLMWASQGAAVSPLAVCLRPSRAKDATPSAVSGVQGKFARECRSVLHSVAKINEPHRRLLFEGLVLVERWARSEEGMGRWRHAAAVLQVADTLVAWFCGGHTGQPQLFGRGQPLTIPDHVLPYTSRPARDT